MNGISDENIRRFCILIQTCEEPMINGQQKVAAEMLVELAQKGNSDAIAALQNLERFPWIHPHLHEIVAEGLRNSLLPPASSSPYRSNAAPSTQQ